MKQLHNTTPWSPGDFVIHADDSKYSDMLMQIKSISKSGVYRSYYIDPQTKARYKRKIWINKLEKLLDPNFFGITVPH